MTSSKESKNSRASDDNGHRFRRIHRLLNASSFSRVFKKSQRSRDTFFTVLYRSNDGTGARLGLAISKKDCRLASGRNRIKRIVRESFRRHKDALEGFDVVVRNMPAAAQADNATLYESLERHWQRCRSSEEQAGLKRERR